MRSTHLPTDVDRIYRMHRTRLIHLAGAITLDRALAEEVMQDAFVGLQRRLDHIDDPVGYLQRSVVNLSLSLLRRRRVVSRSPMPVALVAVNPEIDDTWAAVATLPPRERAVVVLRYWQDMSEAEITASLGWPNGTVKSTLHRALKRLRKELPQ
jgi:DNA-directed RNA polymerase specialized sigma24 family protein